MPELAISGCKPIIVAGTVRERWPVITEDDISAVVSALRGGRVSWLNDCEVHELEREWAVYVGVRHCIALNSGTAALHAAVAAAGVEPGDEVLVPALTFLASASSVVHHQGIPVFVDVDPYTYTIDPTDIEARMTERTRAVMPVHLHGLPADMNEVVAIARRRGLVVIEDAAQAHGARYQNRSVGSLGDMAAFSIMAGKNLPTAGEGGLFTTDDPGLRDRADRLKMFGERVIPGEPREYNALTMGWNYRFSSILASFARSQLRRLGRHTTIVQENARYLADRLAELPGVVPPHVPADRTHVYHHFRFRVDPVAAGLDLPVDVFRRALQDVLRADGVELTQYQTRPLPGQVFFEERRGYGKGCPWTCRGSSGQVTYDWREYPQTLDVIRSSLLIGSRLCMATFLDRHNVELYASAFEKVFSNLDEVAAYARGLAPEEPWDQVSTLW